jgi:predicted ester cyclase
VTRDILIPFAVAGVLAATALLTGESSAGEKKADLEKIHGRIQFVTSFPDYRVMVVESFPDLKVQMVTSFPDKPGQWQKVDGFADYKVQIVDSFPDFTIQYVKSFPGTTP